MSAPTSGDPPGLSSFQPAHVALPTRRDSFSSLDADDEADEAPASAKLLATPSASQRSTPAPALPSRHSRAEFMRERARAGHHHTTASDKDDEDDDEDGGVCGRVGSSNGGADSHLTSDEAEARRTGAVANSPPPPARAETLIASDYQAAQRRPSPAPAPSTTPPSPSIPTPRNAEDSDRACDAGVDLSSASTLRSATAAKVVRDSRVEEVNELEEAQRRELLRSKMQAFGCCVLFFPSPVVSWLFPMTGNVAITNAEGSRLYTFETSYYVREERLLTVLDTVLAEDENFVDLLEDPKPAQPAPRRVASPCAAHLQPSSDGYVTSPLMAPRTPFTGAPPQQSPRRKAKPASSKGHAHARCVRIWDLKPLLMEARSRRRGQGGGAGNSDAVGAGGDTVGAPSGRHHSGPAATLWNLLRQELNNAVYNSGMTSDSDYSASGSRARRAAMSSGGSSGGVTEDEDKPYEFLDASTARMFNRNLQATIKIFRGSPHGGSTQSERLLEELNSFSFVCFVLEACGVGGWASPPPRTMRPRQPPRLAVQPPAMAATPTITGTKSGAAGATDSAKHADSGDEDDVTQTHETSWGFVKLCIHLSMFGKWYRCGGRARRVLHGGSFTSAVLLWALLLAFLFYYLFPPHQWGALVGLAQSISRGVWLSWMNATSHSDQPTSSASSVQATP